MPYFVIVQKKRSHNGTDGTQKWRNEAEKESDGWNVNYNAILLLIYFED